MPSTQLRSYGCVPFGPKRSVAARSTVSALSNTPCSTQNVGSFGDAVVALAPTAPGAHASE